MIPTSFHEQLLLLGPLPPGLCSLIPPHYISITISAPYACVWSQFFWITVAAEVVPGDWSHWSYPFTDQPDGCCFHTAHPADVLGCPTPQALLSILALSKEFSFIVFGLLPCRQETQPECFCIFFYDFCFLIYIKPHLVSSLLHIQPEMIKPTSETYKKIRLQQEYNFSVWALFLPKWGYCWIPTREERLPAILKAWAILCLCV